ncbi:hypothetical protein AUC69_04140 [Methyloceanibacter superfactus]|uniref:Uncharacterized protein n=1 Tax=Methyloceanibacter superfactus TaxID=1774969 RepID=A0A1E3VJQ6_9HYPH|nr:hypothetical protein AUC69_04140 [Methyloceanibacter superfactus]
MHREQPRDHALDIAVDRGGARAEGDGRDGRRRIGADAGEFAQLGLGLRKGAAMLVGDDASAGMKIAGAGE